MRYLVHNGYQVTGLVRREIKPLPGVVLLRGDMTDEVFLAEALSGADVVIHAAALTRSADPSELQSANQDLTARLSRQAAAYGVKRFIYLSSDLAEQPAGPYGQSKLAMRKYRKNGGA